MTNQTVDPQLSSSHPAVSDCQGRSPEKTTAEVSCMGLTRSSCVQCCVTSARQPEFRRVGGLSGTNSVHIYGGGNLRRVTRLQRITLESLSPSAKWVAPKARPLRLRCRTTYFSIRLACPPYAFRGAVVFFQKIHGFDLGEFIYIPPELLDHTIPNAQIL